MIRLQEWIHRLEEGGGAKYVRRFVAVAAFIAVAAMYDALCFHNLPNPEAMDAAQLARSLAHGKGFTTLCVRPLSIKFTMDHQRSSSGMLNEGHKDISNPPLYSLVLAPLVRLLPEPGELASVKDFNIYRPDLGIALLNQVLFGIGALLVFRLALEWFNPAAAWVSGILFVLTELYWRFTISGLSTMLLIDFILVLCWLLAHLERGGQEDASMKWLLSHAALIGVVTGLIMLTRYAVGWLILPVTVFVVACSARRRYVLAGMVFVSFVLITAPWIVRTTMLSGWPLGTATFSALQDTPLFPSDTLERSLVPAFTGLPGYRWQILWGIGGKFVANMREILTAELPRLGGNWLWAFFLVGLMVRFQNPGLNRLRWFTVGALLVMVGVQAVARTHLSIEVPLVNSENLLVLLSPLVLIFGVGLFFVLFESWDMPTLTWRYGTVASFVTIVSLPLLLTFFPPHPRTVSPPYYPPRIQQVGHYLSERELLVTDIPWAVAWYANRQSVWLPANARSEFFEIHDYLKTVNGLYVSGRTTDTKFYSNWLRGENQGWGPFLLQSLARGEIPNGFPLKDSPEGLFANGELLLMDRDRWSPSQRERNF